MMAQTVLTKLNSKHEQPRPSANLSSSEGSYSWLELHSLLLASLCIIFCWPWELETQYNWPKSRNIFPEQLCKIVFYFFQKIAYQNLPAPVRYTVGSIEGLHRHWVEQAHQSALVHRACHLSQGLCPSDKFDCSAHHFQTDIRQDRKDGSVDMTFL